MRALPEKRKPVADQATGSLEIGMQGSISYEHHTAPKLSPQEKWKLANPKAVWAQHALRSALKRGLIVKQPCEVCSDPDSEGHHADYDKPMDVQWLCRRHHKAEHKRLKAGGE